jgi:hypothetical protein
MNDTLACYCHGTRLLTDHGEVAVERLAIGDRVITANGTARPIDWIGRYHIDACDYSEPDNVQPIVMRANAIAEGMPHRDLRLSPDHAVLFDDVLIPVKLLVNGASIQRETLCHSVTYYHVELDTHDILLAEAVPAESYLDTGNRGIYENAGASAAAPAPDSGQRQREAESCRRFVDDAPSVEPFWRHLADRAVALGFDLPVEVKTTADPDLRVVLGGRTIKPVDIGSGSYTFLLTGDLDAVRLLSRAARPCDVRPWVEDHRRLGVMVSQLTLKRGTAVEVVPLDHPHLSQGWWDVEHAGSALRRWTNGDAVLPLAGEGPAVLEVTVAGCLDYPA